MARKDEALRWLRKGLYPSLIAQEMDISAKSVIQYLCTIVGERSLRLSELYFSWPPEKRNILQQAGEGRYPNNQLLSSNGLCRDEYNLFKKLRSHNVFGGDMYEHVAVAEVAIHRLVRARLEHEFGREESGWWREGISMNIRKKCVARREEDDEPCEMPYAYTTLIDLSDVISKNWSLFQTAMPKCYRKDRKQLKSDLFRLNKIRNSVMHPVKERKWSEDDFEFVREMSNIFHPRDASDNRNNPA